MLRRQEMHKISMQMMMVFMQTTSSHNTYFWQTQLIARLQFGSNLKCTQGWYIEYQGFNDKAFIRYSSYLEL